MTDSTGVIAAICASTRHASCAILTPDHEIVSRDAPKLTGSILTREVATLFEQANRSPNELGVVRIDLGPGSYTGLRVATTFARFAARYGGASVECTTSFELIAAELRATGFDGQARIALDARRGRVHVGAVNCSSAVHATETPRAIPIDEFEATICDGELIVGEDSLKGWLPDRCRARGNELVDVPAYGATTLFSSDLSLTARDPSDLEPLYLMGSYAD